jgi:C4-dicarboxylate-specific signal transduction histidine kinase
MKKTGAITIAQIVMSDRLQILNLLLSTYEAAVQKNLELSQARDELQKLNEELEARVAQRTAALAAEIAERKASEQCLGEAEARYRALVETTTVGQGACFYFSLPDREKGNA